MLSDLEVIGVLPAKDLQRAQGFYKDKLGLEPVEVRADGAMYRTSAGSFLLYETPNAGSAKNTQLCWITDDIEGEVARLREKGVVFEDYDFPGLKTENGIAVTEGIKGAWFLDTEGNILCLSERI
ncbi:VOC family protein [Cryobacterium tagatosivorans]|uniref:VOC family protein n=1 Tax=Cryobacterium tagatosivorans TaxID=1259199 RepID=A0A4R8UG66_9MICO|nr:VOC family protein [Cryobacterium tagatosivorans]TFB53889.1 VOC family protein [Cryobacterium tagatosivorans]